MRLSHASANPPQRLSPPFQVIMTTNHKERLDPALIRPGRVDVKFEYGYATSSMIRELFVLFYPVEGEGGDETETKTQEKRNTTC